MDYDPEKVRQLIGQSNKKQKHKGGFVTSLIGAIGRAVSKVIPSAAKVVIPAAARAVLPAAVRAAVPAAARTIVPAAARAAATAAAKAAIPAAAKAAVPAASKAAAKAASKAAAKEAAEAAAKAAASANRAGFLMGAAGLALGVGFPAYSIIADQIQAEKDKVLLAQQKLQDTIDREKSAELQRKADIKDEEYAKDYAADRKEREDDKIALKNREKEDEDARDEADRLQIIANAEADAAWEEEQDLILEREAAKELRDYQNMKDAYLEALSIYGNGAAPPYVPPPLYDPPTYDPSPYVPPPSYVPPYVPPPTTYVPPAAPRRKGGGKSKFSMKTLQRDLMALGYTL